VALLRIPRLGRHYVQVVVEGVQVEDLRKGPGHYPGTALPGRIGNFVVSGHRTTYGAPFGSLDRLRTGDPIVLETGAGWYIYRTTRREIVPPTAVDVTAPVPERPGVRPIQAMLTFTTCHPRYSARKRLVVFGLLRDSLPRTGGEPAPLAS
jgi:sortase A